MDEGYGRYGVAAELAAVVAQGAFYNLDAPVSRLCAMHVPIPFSPSLEDVTVPNERQVVDLALKLCGKVGCRQTTTEHTEAHRERAFSDPVISVISVVNRT